MEKGFCKDCAGKLNMIIFHNIFGNANIQVKCENCKNKSCHKFNPNYLSSCKFYIESKQEAIKIVRKSKIKTIL